jgi:excisionase family DNA binding protein
MVYKRTRNPRPAAPILRLVTSDFYSVPAAATMLGVSAKTVRRWIAAGHLAALRTPGGQYLVARAELERLVDEMRYTPAATAAVSFGDDELLAVLDGRRYGPKDPAGELAAAPFDEWGTLGERIKSARIAAVLGQEDLAEMLDVNPRTLARWERDLQEPRVGDMHRIAVATRTGFVELCAPWELNPQPADYRFDISPGQRRYRAA